MTPKVCVETAKRIELSLTEACEGVGLGEALRLVSNIPVSGCPSGISLGCAVGI